ncbi:MAG: histidine kinase dimerization/phosphoacceptor domain -containing protein [Bryobacteraceae bacterium]|jgi:two-component sensor histidine kinase
MVAERTVCSLDPSEKPQPQQSFYVSRPTPKEKEVLLREIHHRVKNNLQIVSSLIRLQANRLADPLALAQCAETLERIKSIALLHEKLYLSKNLAKIDFSEYVPNRVSSLQAAYRADPRTVRMEVAVKNVFASSCGGPPPRPSPYAWRITGSACPTPRSLPVRIPWGSRWGPRWCAS